MLWGKAPAAIKPKVLACLYALPSLRPFTDTLTTLHQQLVRTAVAA